MSEKATLGRKSAEEILDLYFIENRARLLDIASFLDRIDRYGETQKAKGDFRYRAFMAAIKILTEAKGERTKKIQLLFSDQTTTPVDSARGLKTTGAWEGFYEGD